MAERIPRNKIFRTTAMYIVLLAPLFLVVTLIYISTRPDIPNVIVRCDAPDIRRGQPLLTLSEEQCQAIGHNVAIGNRAEETRMTAHEALRNILKVGDQPPENIELSSLPQEVVGDHPGLQKYRYFIVEDEIAITDPDEKKIVAFVEVHRN